MALTVYRRLTCEDEEELTSWFSRFRFSLLLIVWRMGGGSPVVLFFLSQTCGHMSTSFFENDRPSFDCSNALIAGDNLPASTVGFHWETIGFQGEASDGGA